MPGSRPPVGMKIKRARERLRMTQAQLGAALGVSQKTVDNWEHDKTYPKSAIGALEEVLGISLGETPSAGITPEDDWERLVLEDQTLPYAERADIVRRSRRLRAELYPALEPPSAQHAAREAPAPEPHAG